MKLHANMHAIRKFINDTDRNILAEFWNCRVNESNKYEKWFELMSANVRTNSKVEVDIIASLILR